MSKYNTKGVYVILTVGLVIGGLSGKIYSLYGKIEERDNQTLRYETTIENLSKLSPIEIDEIDLKEAQLDSDKYKKLEAESKRLKEQAIWKTRCLKKKIIGEEKNCSENLERYASYNVKK